MEALQAARRRVFNDNKAAAVVRAKLSLLLRMRLVRSELIPTTGRDAERWFAVQHASNTVRDNVINVQSPLAAPPFHVNHVNHVPRYAKNVAQDREVFEL